MFCGLFNFDQNRCIRTLPAWPFCWLIFLVDFLKCWKYPSNSSETFKMLFFYQNNQFEGKTACFADFSIFQKYPDLTGVAILLVDFFGWFFEMLKIPFQFFWNIFVISSKQSVWRKNSMFCGLFNFDQNRCIQTLPAWPFCWLIFLVDFLKCWKYPSNSSETFKLLFFHQNNQFEAKTACFADFKILTKIAVSGPYRRGYFLGWFFEMLKIPFQFFWNIQNFVLSWKQSVWRKNSMFCGLFNFDQNRCIQTLPAWPFCWLIFLVDFLKCWKYPSNSSETLKLLFFHQNNQFEAKTACFAEFKILTKIAVSGPYRRGYFFGWFFEMLKIPFQFFWNIQNFVLSWKQSVWRKNSMFCGLFNFDQNRCIRTLPTWPFCWLIFLVDFLKCWKYPSNSSETFKMLFFYQNNQFEAKAACFADFSILTKIAVSGPYRRGHFVSWFFEMLKIPFQFFWNIHETCYS